MTDAKAFIDTNIWLYLYGGSDTAKQLRAKELIHELTVDDRVLISTQVVQEFYVNARRLKMSRPALSSAIAGLLDLPMIVAGVSEIRSAIIKEASYQISFWDALILAAAESGGAGVVYTEDLNHGQKFGGVVVRNPFAE